MCFRVFPAVREVGGIHEGGPTAATDSTQIAPFAFQIWSRLKLPICLLTIISGEAIHHVLTPILPKPEVAKLVLLLYPYVRIRTTSHLGRVTLWPPRESLGALNDMPA